MANKVRRTRMGLLIDLCKSCFEKENPGKERYKWRHSFSVVFDSNKEDMKEEIEQIKALAPFPVVSVEWEESSEIG